MIKSPKISAQAFFSLKTTIFWLNPPFELLKIPRFPHSSHLFPSATSAMMSCSELVSMTKELPAPPGGLGVFLVEKTVFQQAPQHVPTTLATSGAVHLKGVSMKTRGRFQDLGMMYKVHHGWKIFCMRKAPGVSPPNYDWKVTLKHQVKKIEH